MDTGVCGVKRTRPNSACIVDKQESLGDIGVSFSKKKIREHAQRIDFEPKAIASEMMAEAMIERNDLQQVKVVHKIFSAAAANADHAEFNGSSTWTSCLRK
ncbi:unnamed protein product [Phytophthora lilii]|uniref:Unnamed protein product n=1 Tax=Phytophthora lilii TaxID=2077276 RepID=A0A9W6YHL6_9STRA|nr:unnamed protein product [Phytophthora lilii]